jgi:hypothetical protein
MVSPSLKPPRFAFSFIQILGYAVICVLAFATWGASTPLDSAAAATVAEFAVAELGKISDSRIYTTLQLSRIINAETQVNSIVMDGPPTLFHLWLSLCVSRKGFSTTMW